MNHDQFVSVKNLSHFAHCWNMNSIEPLKNEVGTDYTTTNNVRIQRQRNTFI